VNHQRSRSTTPGRSASTVTEDVVAAVADAKGTSALDIQPLGTVVDTDALNRLVERQGRWPTEPSARIEFSYEGFTVTVTGDGDVDVSDPTA
jgi:hypothetical protein